MFDSGIQHNQTQAASSGFGYEAGECVPVVLPPDVDDKVESDARADSMQAVLNLIALMTTNATPLQTGQRIHLLAYQLGLTAHKTHAELGRKLNVSPGRVSQIIRELPSELRALVNLNSRTAKARP
jgi:hypothetical protein